MASRTRDHRGIRRNTSLLLQNVRLLTYLLKPLGVIRRERRVYARFVSFFFFFFDAPLFLGNQCTMIHDKKIPGLVMGGRF